VAPGVGRDAVAQTCPTGNRTPVLQFVASNYKDRAMSIDERAKHDKDVMYNKRELSIQPTAP
jgi:hypothetical protein